MLDVADLNGQTVDEVAAILGFSKDLVRQIEDKALEKLGALGIFEGRPLRHELYPVRIKGNEDRMRDILTDAASRGTAMEMGKYLGCSFVSVYSWIKRFFGCSFWEFKRQVVCTSDRCAVVETADIYSRDDYLMKKIRKAGRCSCCNGMPDGFIMTNASLDVISQVVSSRRGYLVERLDEKAFMVVAPA